MEQSQLLARDVLTKELILRNDPFYPNLNSILLKNIDRPECIGVFHGISVFHIRLMELHGITIGFEVPAENHGSWDFGFS